MIGNAPKYIPQVYAICTPAIQGIPYASATLKTPKIHIRACICIYKKSHNLICNMGPWIAWQTSHMGFT